MQTVFFLALCLFFSSVSFAANEDDAVFKGKCNFTVTIPNAFKLGVNKEKIYQDPPTCDPGKAEKQAEAKRDACLKNSQEFCEQMGGFFWSKGNAFHGNGYVPGYSNGKKLPIINRALVPYEAKGSSGADWECWFF